METINDRSTCWQLAARLPYRVGANTMVSPTPHCMCANTPATDRLPNHVLQYGQLLAGVDENIILTTPSLKQFVSGLNDGEVPAAAQSYNINRRVKFKLQTALRKLRRKRCHFCSVASFIVDVVSSLIGCFRVLLKHDLIIAYHQL